MIDQEKREKVIKGLKWCMNEKHDCYMEKGCPYENKGDDVGCKYALHRDALALLKAQEPRVIRNSAGNGICPGCGRIIPAWSSPNYCGYCGQAVKWE